MANLYLGINRGEVAKDVVSGSSTNSTDIELRMDDTKGLSKADVIRSVEFLLNKLKTSNVAIK